MMDYSDRFIKIFAEETEDGFKSREKYRLPKRWDGKDFRKTIFELFKEYENDVRVNYKEMVDEIMLISRCLYNSLVKSYQGFSQESYRYFENAMGFLKESPLLFDIESQNWLRLYRVVDAGNTRLPDRSRVFHIPFSMRSIMSKQRFSIPGFPCLYLGSSLELCCEEVRTKIPSPSVIASEFRLCPYDPQMAFDYREVNVFDLGISPNRLFDTADEYVMDEKNYLRWYPLIAACSFIRARKEDPYAPEYVLSQHFMQWIRTHDYYKIPGVRYFSCSSEHAAELGDNFAFPTAGVPYPLRGMECEYDVFLTRRFMLTNPYFLNDSISYQEYAERLSNETAGFIESRLEPFVSGVFTIPEGEIEIEHSAFANCIDLTEIIIPESVVSIGDNAFIFCMSLEKISIPNSVTTIGNGAFSFCESLTEVVIPDSVTSFGNDVFIGCYNLTDIVIPEYITSIGNCVFVGCRNLTSIVIPNGIVSIGNYAFFECESLKEIVIPDSVTSIGDYAFEGCSSLNGIFIPSSVTSIGDDAFKGCINCDIVIDEKNPVYYCRDNCIYEWRNDR